MRPFVLFGTPHLVAMCLVLAVPMLLSLVTRRLGEPTTTVICVAFATLVFGNEIVHWFYRVATEGWPEFVRLHLPLHVCGIATNALVILLLFRNRYAFEIVYFWGLAGTANAVITPQLDAGYPEYRFFQFFIAHGGIVAGALFAVWGLKMRPTFAALLRVYGSLGVFAILLLAVNALLDSNYMFLRTPPATASPFFFAPWPYYIVFLAVLAFVFFCFLLAPFEVAKRWRHARQGT